MTVCCLNHSYPIGNVNENSVIEIWNSERVKSLRKSIVNKQLNLGCSKCKKKIIDKDYSTIMAKSYDGYSDSLYHHDYPKSLIFELSTRCNLQCKMCWGHYSSEIRSRVDELKLIKEHYDQQFPEEIPEFILAADSISFLGAEPMLIPVYDAILEIAKWSDTKKHIVSNTNCTIYNEKFIVKALHHNFTLNLSIDSFRKGTFESIRQGASFEKSMANFYRYLELRNVNSNFNFGVSLCPLRYNMYEIPDIMVF